MQSSEEPLSSTSAQAETIDDMSLTGKHRY